jgi:hypothetical protein
MGGGRHSRYPRLFLDELYDLVLYFTNNLKALAYIIKNGK